MSQKSANFAAEMNEGARIRFPRLFKIYQL